MQRLALLFPGQGSQYPGMGRDLYDAEPAARAVFAEADEALGFDLTSLILSGPEAELQLTENTQPAVLTVSVAAARALLARGITPVAGAGHSLGEYSALVVASALSLRDAVRLVRLRGRYMQEAVAVGQGAMAAVLGLPPAEVEAACAEAARDQVVVAANYNSPDQTVIAGHADAVRRAVAVAEARGAKRAVLLAVSAPFHSPLMAPAAARLGEELAAVALARPLWPVVCNVDAEPLVDPGQVREALRRQVTAPVRWAEGIATLKRLGAEAYVEAGPGRVLTGLLRRIDRGAPAYNVEDLKGLEQAATALGAQA